MSHLPDAILYVLLFAVVALSFVQKYFVDATVIKKEDVSRLVGGIWIPRRLLTPAGRRIRLTRDLCLAAVAVLTVILQTSPYYG